MKPNYIEQTVSAQIEEDLGAEDFKTIKKFTVEEVVELLKTSHKIITVEGYKVKTDNPRYHLIKHTDQHMCVWCQIPAEIAYLRAQKNARPGDAAIFTFHDAKDTLLYTKDHIMPRKRGGPDALWNYQNMCHVCNQAKGHGVPSTSRFENWKSPYTADETRQELFVRKQFGH